MFKCRVAGGSEFAGYSRDTPDSVLCPCLFPASHGACCKVSSALRTRSRYGCRVSGKPRAVFLGLEENVNTDLKEVLGEQRKLSHVKNNSRNVMFLDCLKRKPRKLLLRDVYLTCQVRERSCSLKLVSSIHLESPFQLPCFKEKMSKQGRIE